MACSLPGSSIYGILQARKLEWITTPFARGFFQFRDQTWDFLHCRQILTIWANTKVDSIISGLYFYYYVSQSVISVAQSCPTLCDPMSCSTPGLPVQYQLPEPTQTPLSRWRHPTTSSSIVPFSSCLQSFLVSGSFQMSQLFAWGGQSIGVSSSTSDIPMNTLDWSPLGWLIGSPCSPRDSQESSPTPQFKSINTSVLTFFIVQLSHPYMTTGKTIALTRWTFVGKVMPLLFNNCLGWS